MFLLAAVERAAVGLKEGPSVTCLRAVLDSRQVSEGDLFVCLRGEQTDGHLFVADAVRWGAKALLIERACEEEVRLRLADSGLLEPAVGSGSLQILSSDDVLQTLQQMARLRRRSYNGTVLAVVGSNGKTSTKEILSSLLRCRFGNDAVYATPGNWNNHLGLPLTLLSLPDEARFAVVELGMNHPGEIEFLAHLALPHHCVVPSIGFEHMEFFSSVEEVAHAELEILDGMNGGLILYPVGAPGREWLIERAAEQKVMVQFFEMSKDATGPDHRRDAAVFRARYLREDGFEFQGQRFTTGDFAGEAMTSNVFACVALLLQLTDEWKSQPAQLAECTSVLRASSKGRFRQERIGPILLVDDSYNANPDSFRQSIRTLRELLPTGRLLCLAGHMAELGHFSEQGHRQVGADLDSAGFADLLVCGNTDVLQMQAAFRKDEAGRYFADSESMSAYIEDHPELLEDVDGILVKGSRSARMEKVLPLVRKQLCKLHGIVTD